MNKNIEKNQKRDRRKKRVRAKLFGTAKRPRLSVARSLKHIFCQLIDDDAQKTIITANDRKMTGTKMEKAKQVGAAIAKKALAKKITAVVYDRGGYQYHGRVKTLADSARENGLKF